MTRRLTTWLVAACLAIATMAATPPASADESGWRLALNPPIAGVIYPDKVQFTTYWMPVSGLGPEPSGNHEVVTYAPASGGTEVTCPDGVCGPALPGSYTVTARRGGQTATAPMQVSKREQRLDFADSPPSTAPGSTWRPKVSTNSTSMTAVTVNSDSSCTISEGTVTFVHGGRCTVLLSNPGDEVTTSATKDRTVDIAPVQTAITARMDPDTPAVMYSKAYVLVHVSPAIANSSVTVRSAGAYLGRGSVRDSGDLRVPVDMVKAGPQRLTVTYAPPITDWSTTSSTTIDVDVARAPQHLAFSSSAPSAAKPGDTYRPDVQRGRSRAPVVLGTSPVSSSVCHVVGGLVTFDTVGTCVVTADQAGDDTFADAEQARQTIEVGTDPVITADPASQTVLAGKTVLFTVESSGHPTPTVQWLRSRDGGWTWSFVRGATSSTLEVVAQQDDDGDLYRAMVTNDRGDAQSAAARLTVQTPAEIDAPGAASWRAGVESSVTITTTGSPSPTVTATEAGGGPLRFWLALRKTGPTSYELVGTPPTTMVGTYEVDLTADNGLGGPVTRRLTLTIQDPIVFSAPTSARLTVGEPVSIPVSAENGRDSVGFSIDLVGELPKGLTYRQDELRTGTISGTPARGSVGTYDVLLDAPYRGQHKITLTVGKGTQDVTFTSAPAASPTVGGSYTPTAKASSDGAVAFSVHGSTTKEACSMRDGVVRFEHAGTCVVAADQSGTDDYEAAPQATQTFEVSSVATTTTVTLDPQRAVAGQPVTATAAVGSASGEARGSVRFAVDGTPVGGTVEVVDRRASVPLGALPVGDRTVTATFLPTDPTTLGASEGRATIGVDKAQTKTSVEVDRGGVVARVVTEAPGAGTPTGTVEVSVGGEPFGTARLVDGVARLDRSVPSAAARTVAVVYPGDEQFAGSSASTSRTDPVVTTATSGARSASGWFTGPVTVTFSCEATTAPLVDGCPSPVVLDRDGANQSVTRTVLATDGGVTTVTVDGIRIDRTAPTVRVAGVRHGAVYRGTAPRPRCVGGDTGSGLQSCAVRRKTVRTGNGTAITYTAIATDRAGHRSTATGRYRVLGRYLEGAAFKDGRFQVRLGRSYTLVVTDSSKRPSYRHAELSPRRPWVSGPAMHRAGERRWALTVRMDAGMRARKHWNLGVVVGGKTLKVPVTLRR